MVWLFLSWALGTAVLGTQSERAEEGRVIWGTLTIVFFLGQIFIMGIVGYVFSQSDDVVLWDP